MPAYLRPTLKSDSKLKFAGRTYMGALAIATLGGGAFAAAYSIGHPLARLYFTICGVVCALGATWRLFWRDELTIDILQRSYIRRRGHWPRIVVYRGLLDDIAAVVLILESRHSDFAEVPVWVIGLKFTNSAKPLLVAEFLKAERNARSYAESLAAQLQRPFIDGVAAGKTFT